MLASVVSSGVRRTCVRSFSAWDSVPTAPPDAILNLTWKYKDDPNPNKVNVGVGAFRTDKGEPWVLPSVAAAYKMLGPKVEDNKLEYLPISGLPEFVDRASKFAYGEDCDALAEGRVAAVQSLSGTGALRLGSGFIHSFWGSSPAVYTSNPTWGNHPAIVRASGQEYRTYRYLAEDGVSLDFAAMMEDVHAMEEGAVVLLHACAHNPTGVDPTFDQWRELEELMASKGHVAFFDNAYQGFATGDAVADAAPLRYFVAQGNVPVMMAQSFSKNFGLYGERVGTLSVVTTSPEEAAAVESQLKIQIRSMYSNPPSTGARVVATILGDEALTAQWFRECKMMADRIANMRSLLKDALDAAGDGGRDWNHIVDQIGMFAFTGLKPDEVASLTDDHSVYMTKDGRISMAGVTPHNVEYLADCIHKVTSN